MTLSPVRAPWTETKQAFVWKAKSHFSLPLTSAALPCTTRCASDPLPLPRAATGAAGRPAPQPQHRQQLWQQGQSPTHSSALLFGPGLKPGVRMHSTCCFVCTRKDRNSSSALTLKALQSPTRAKTEIQKCFWKKTHHSDWGTYSRSLDSITCFLYKQFSFLDLQMSRKYRQPTVSPES